jgi:hypothetical protein
MKWTSKEIRLLEHTIVEHPEINLTIVSATTFPHRTYSSVHAMVRKLRIKYGKRGKYKCGRH